ncbi:MAG: hypothetical protein LBS69_04070 [Prevotellaceae bacterium]|jgi:hypothetical protein|nr:hypothetical protein [Prevotellaceae bacterium]
MTENKIDSAKNLVEYWKQKCGISEPVFRATILLALIERNFTDSILPNETLRYIINYKSRVEMIKSLLYFDYNIHENYYGYVPPGQEFDKFTSQLARELKDTYDTASIEYLFAEFYGDGSDKILSKIQLPEYQENKIAKEYNKITQHHLKKADYHAAFFSGVWVPTGELKQIGWHPEIGYQIGLKYGKMNYDLVMALKFINSPNYYWVKRKHSLPEQTRYFVGGTMGLDFGRDVFVSAKRKHEIQIIAGVAYDGFTVIKEDKDNKIEPLHVNSYNFNIGFGYRYYVNTWYLGLKIKYNFVDYSLNNVINFTGNPITASVVIGFVNNKDKNDILEMLQYN